MKHIKVRRFLLIFEKITDIYVGEVEFPADPELKVLQKIFGVHSKNPMFDVYEINEKNVKDFTKIFYYDFDFSKFEYAIACESTS